MIQPVCVHCRSTRFELYEAPDIEGAAYVLTIVRCANCGTPIGVLEKENINDTLAQHDGAIDALGDRLVNIEAKIDRVLNDLAAIQQRLK